MSKNFVGTAIIPREHLIFDFKTFESIGDILLCLSNT